MKITIVQTILQIEFPDGNSGERRAARGDNPLHPSQLVTHNYPPDEDAYYRVLEMWEAEGGRV